MNALRHVLIVRLRLNLLAHLRILHSSQSHISELPDCAAAFVNAREPTSRQFAPNNPDTSSHKRSAQLYSLQ